MRHSFAAAALACAFSLLQAGGAFAVTAADAMHAHLVDQQGVPFTLASLRGEPVILTFVASRCTDACPIADAMFRQLQTRLRRERLTATLVTVTLDPEFDAPMVMARVASEYGANHAHWRLASGSVRNVHVVMSAFGVKPERGPDGVPDVHSTFVYVLDGRGKLQRTLLLSTNSTAEVTAAIKALGA